MPYGIKKSAGGDSLKNVARTEACVRSVMSKNAGMDKSRAIAICKSQLFGPQTRRK